ncbi:RDD family protein [Cytobacillus massiliigabonensis]|uniref:RDD family protein n=1 Tax=Cytobacillus massiliigabonensis TaxID=1871011 RepID=UPI000C821A7F|nr:RDD family protein [Cytobacillus massiliigabonensis]
MKIRKRIFGYVIDFFISIAICVIFSILTFIILAIIALLFLPFVASDGDTWNPILSVIMNGMLLLGTLVFMVTSLGANLKLTLTWGYKFNGLILENTSKIRLFTWWFIRNGIAGLFIFLFAYHFANDKGYRYLLVTIFIYIIYLLIDGAVFFLTKGKKTFTDIWTGIEVSETTKV